MDPLILFGAVIFAIILIVIVILIYNKSKSSNNNDDNGGGDDDGKDDYNKRIVTDKTNVQGIISEPSVIMVLNWNYLTNPKVTVENRNIYNIFKTETIGETGKITILSNDVLDDTLTISCENFDSLDIPIVYTDANPSGIYTEVENASVDVGSQIHIMIYNYKRLTNVSVTSENENIFTVSVISTGMTTINGLSGGIAKLIITADSVDEHSLPITVTGSVPSESEIKISPEEVQTPMNVPAKLTITNYNKLNNVTMTVRDATIATANRTNDTITVTPVSEGSTVLELNASNVTQTKLVSITIEILDLDKADDYDDTTAETAIPERIVGYYTNWTRYRVDNPYTPKDIPTNLLSHIVYAFFPVNDTHEVKYSDSWADFGLNGIADVIALKGKDIVQGIMFSVGGWSYSGDGLGKCFDGSPEGDDAGIVNTKPFYQIWNEILTVDSYQTAFINSVISMIDKHGFDGVNIDLEHPVCPNNACDDSYADQKAGYVKLLKNLRAKLGSKLLSIAGAASYKVLDKGYDLSGIADSIDWIDVMTYDFHVSADGKSGHNQPKRDTTDGFDVNYTLYKYLDAKVPGIKLNVGVALYTRGYSLSEDIYNQAVADSKFTNLPIISGSAATPVLATEGTAGQFELATQYTLATSVYIENEGSWLLNDETKELISYTDIKDLQALNKIRVRKGIGGVLYYAIDQDDYIGTNDSTYKNPIMNSFLKIAKGDTSNENLFGVNNLQLVLTNNTLCVSFGDRPEFNNGDVLTVVNLKRFDELSLDPVSKYLTVLGDVTKGDLIMTGTKSGKYKVTYNGVVKAPQGDFKRSVVIPVYVTDTFKAYINEWNLDFNDHFIFSGFDTKTYSYLHVKNWDMYNFTAANITENDVNATIDNEHKCFRMMPKEGVTNSTFYISSRLYPNVEATISVGFTDNPETTTSDKIDLVLSRDVQRQAIVNADQNVTISAIDVLDLNILEFEKGESYSQLIFKTSASHPGTGKGKMLILGTSMFMLDYTIAVNENEVDLSALKITPPQSQPGQIIVYNVDKIKSITFDSDRATYDKGIISIAPGEPTTDKITIKATCDPLDDFTIYMDNLVFEPPNLSTNSLTMAVNTSSVVNITNIGYFNDIFLKNELFAYNYSLVELSDIESNGDFTINALAVGSTLIEVKCQGYQDFSPYMSEAYATIRVIIIDVDGTSIQTDTSDVTLKVGNSAAINIINGQFFSGLTVTSSDETIAKASINNNIVTCEGIKIGKTTLVVKASDNTETTINIIVISSSIQIDPSNVSGIPTKSTACSILNPDMFNDLDVKSNDETIATASLTDDKITINFVALGNTTCMVTASDANPVAIAINVHDSEIKIDPTDASFDVEIGTPYSVQLTNYSNLSNVKVVLNDEAAKYISYSVDVISDVHSLNIVGKVVTPADLKTATVTISADDCESIILTLNSVIDPNAVIKLSATDVNVKISETANITVTNFDALTNFALVSSDEKIATVSVDDKGTCTITGVASGNTTAIASADDHDDVSITITVLNVIEFTPDSLTGSKTESGNLTISNFSDLKNLTCTTDDEKVATVALNDNIVTCTYVDYGDTKIILKADNASETSCPVSVKYKITYDPKDLSGIVGGTGKITITETLLVNLSCESSDESIVTATLADDIITCTFVKAGTANVSITADNAITAVCNITVSDKPVIEFSPSELTGKVGDSGVITVSNAADLNNLACKSEDETIATVAIDSDKITVTYVKAGTTTATITADDADSVTCNITITDE